MTKTEKVNTLYRFVDNPSKYILKESLLSLFLTINLVPFSMITTAIEKEDMIQIINSSTKKKAVSSLINILIDELNSIPNMEQYKVDICIIKLKYLIDLLYKDENEEEEEEEEEEEVEDKKEDKKKKSEKEEEEEEEEEDEDKKEKSEKEEDEDEQEDKSEEDYEEEVVIRRKKGEKKEKKESKKESRKASFPSGKEEKKEKPKTKKEEMEERKKKKKEEMEQRKNKKKEEMEERKKKKKEEMEQRKRQRDNMTTEEKKQKRKEAQEHKKEREEQKKKNREKNEKFWKEFAGGRYTGFDQQYAGYAVPNRDEELNKLYQEQLAQKKDLIESDRFRCVKPYNRREYGAKERVTSCKQQGNFAKGYPEFFNQLQQCTEYCNHE